MIAKNNPSVLLYFTAQYPFGVGEQFIVNEIEGLSRKFDQLLIIPFDCSKGDARKIPENCELIELKTDEGNPKKMLQILQILFSELRKCNNKRYFLKNLRFFYSSLIQANSLANRIDKLIDQTKEKRCEMYFYSTWMNENALALAMLKKRKRISNFSFKMRGYDLFDERRPGGYMPFRSFIFNQADGILTMSKQGANYLREKKICSEKIFHNYPGIVSNGRNEIKEGVFTLVSCSGLIKLKRVEYIAKALGLLDFEIKWVHFGDGPEKENISKIIKNLPQNIEVELKGNVENEKVRAFYVDHKIDAFIHVSETEGFGYAIIEAYCSGIPAILYPAGGVKELIGSSFSQKVTSPLSPEGLARDIEAFKLKIENNQEVKDQAYNFYKENFLVDPNIEDLYSKITSFHHA
ncbi:MAG: glycosyltransferase [Crocinitomicaceae bacterium]